MGTGGSFPGGKAVAVWSLHAVPRSRIRGAILPISNMSSRRGAIDMVLWCGT